MVGEDYIKLKRCICISILDFNMDDDPDYHKIYRLRDEEGKEFSDMFEIHIIELKKTLSGNGRMDDWIRLFNAKSREDLEMIETSNPGILAAIREVKIMGLGKDLLALYEAHMKQVRDRKAEDAYVYDTGLTAGKAEGKAESIVELLAERGEVSEELAKIILEEKEPETLRWWLKAAAKAESVKAFCEQVQINLEKS